jgi:aspartyl-tRNA(Asn)/glutamyl-tRNA(Gln) amidotransferase subunit A
VGLFARNVTDIAVILEVVAGYDARDPASTLAPSSAYRKSLSDEIQGLRVGLPRQFFFEHVDPEILQATLAVAHCAERLGAKLIDIESPNMDEARTVSLLVQMPEALSYHGRYLRSQADLYGEELRSGLAVGQFILAEQYIAAKRMMTLYRQQMAQIFDQVDLLLTPTCPMIAPPIGATTVTIGDKEEPVGNARTRFTSFFNLTGHPALSMPSGWHSSGLPMGLQLIARPFEESTLLRVAHRIESSWKVEQRTFAKS